MEAVRAAVGLTRVAAEPAQAEAALALAVAAPALAEAVQARVAAAPVQAVVAPVQAEAVRAQAVPRLPLKTKSTRGSRKAITSRARSASPGAPPPRLPTVSPAGLR